MQRFTSLQSRLIREINAAEGMQDRVVSSPAAARAVVYRLDRAFDIIVAHEHRHLLQAKEVLAQLPATLP